MTVFSPPPQTRTIGTALVAGKPVAVQADIAWFRFWAQSLYDRVGGATGASSAELAALIAAAQADADAASVLAAAAQVDADDALAQLAALVSPIAGEFVATVPGPAGHFEHDETLAAVGVTAGMKVLLSIAPHSDDDENNEQALDLRVMAGEAGTDTITVRLSFGSLTSGPIRINYMAV